MLSPRRLPIRSPPRLSLRRGRRIARKEEEVGREIVEAHAPGEVASTMTVLRNIAGMAGAAVDRHRHRDVRRAQVEAVIKDAHVVERGDRHPDAPTLPLMSGRRSGSRLSRVTGRTRSTAG
jgi:hypothetical protein